jgi:transcriptional regulator with XRE-family HTH domain
MWQSEQAHMACLEQEIGSEWVPHDHPARHLMPLADRIKQLRTEAGLSQAELAEKAGGGDARQISRYENGRITPSLDAIANIAEALNISIDYLVIDNMPRRPLHTQDHGLGERLAALSELDDNDRDSMLSVLDAMLTRKRLKALAGGNTS